MARYCASCGTEVDDSAAFCPTCGQPIDDTGEVEIPPAPAWPEPQPVEAVPEPPPEAPPHAAGPPAAPEPADRWAPTREVTPAPRHEPDAARQASREPSPPPLSQAGDVPPVDGASGPLTASIPVTWPVMLSGWLVGGGAAIAALGAAVGLFAPSINAWDVVFLLLFLGIAYSVFFASSMPAVPHLRLITLAVVLVGFGMALDRLGFGIGAGRVGAVLLLFGTAAAAIGAMLVELGRDQPLGGGQT